MPMSGKFHSFPDPSKMPPEHVALVKKIVNRYTKKLNSFDRDDAYQAGFIGYLTAVKSYDKSMKCTLKTWIHTKVSYAVLDHIGKVDTLKLCDKMFHVADWRHAESLYLGLESTDFWLNLILRMKPTHKVILLQVFFEDKTQLSIAKKRKIDPARVKQILDEALLELKRLYVISSRNNGKRRLFDYGFTV